MIHRKLQNVVYMKKKSMFIKKKKKKKKKKKGGNIGSCPQVPVIYTINRLNLNGVGFVNDNLGHRCIYRVY